MNSMEGVRQFCIGVFTGLFLAALVSLMIGATPRDMKNLRNEAISAGVAEWRADPATGRVEFVWKKAD